MLLIIKHISYSVLNLKENLMLEEELPNGKENNHFQFHFS